MWLPSGKHLSNCECTETARPQENTNHSLHISTQLRHGQAAGSPGCITPFHILTKGEVGWGGAVGKRGRSDSGWGSGWAPLTTLWPAGKPSWRSSAVPPQLPWLRQGQARQLGRHPRGLPHPRAASSLWPWRGVGTSIQVCESTCSLLSVNILLSGTRTPGSTLGLLVPASEAPKVNNNKTSFRRHSTLTQRVYPAQSDHTTIPLHRPPSTTKALPAAWIYNTLEYFCVIPL